jgi:hypothetical protein
VPPRDHIKLAEAMERFIVNPGFAKTMGQRSHQLARERFDVHAVNRLLLETMNLIKKPEDRMDRL